LGAGNLPAWKRGQLNVGQGGKKVEVPRTRRPRKKEGKGERSEKKPVGDKGRTWRKEGRRTRSPAEERKDPNLESVKSEETFWEKEGGEWVPKRIKGEGPRSDAKQIRDPKHKEGRGFARQFCGRGKRKELTMKKGIGIERGRAGGKYSDTYSGPEV